ncbi:hypothetical protein [Streptomyces antarcticus]|uniref:hypothetical protein n=1 Tax=Streptomyces antarcticus TaxID=2996458 RepID=UPI002270BF54|nr:MULTISPECIES: hypothetical protein [unclassified Streptomyces]MCY0943570.1 hypothetical protein [Streptomyces sp. H34-AA3]MCZ4083521.1 hypothetical protein [Streptomyces sp. H34-S5]
MTAAATVPVEVVFGRPVRHPDPERNATYWARIDAIVAAAPELTTAQRVKLRGIFQQADRQEAA